MAYSMPAARKRSMGGGGSTPSPTGAPGASAGAAPAGQPSDPGYVNFSRLLAVNQGGAQRMADKLATNAQQKGQQATGAIDTAKAGVDQKVQAGTLSYEKAAPQALGNGADPSAYREAGRISGVRAAQGYTGPKDWTAAGYDETALSKQAREASDAAKGLTTAGGRGAELRKMAGGPYSAGMSALDAGLSGAALGDRGQSLAATYGGLSQKLIDYQTATGSAIKAATASSQDAAAKYGADQQAFDAQAAQFEQQQQVPEYLAPAEVPQMLQAPAPVDDRNRLWGVPLSKKKQKPNGGR